MSAVPRAEKRESHRKARVEDASRLAEIRHESILTFATSAMSLAEAKTWAANSDAEDTQRKIRDWQVWVAEEHTELLGWVAFHLDRIEGLYVHPAHAGQGVGTCLLALAETLMFDNGIETIYAEASWNAEGFYHRRGYEFIGPRPVNGARPMRKRLDRGHELDSGDTALE
jgi:putative acetyltransferase